MAELSFDACAFYPDARCENYTAAVAPNPGACGGEGTACMYPKQREQDEKHLALEALKTA